MQVLLRLIQLQQGNEFLPALVNMEMSLHSMEVINRLSMAVHLPSEFVHMYISNCIQSSQAAQVIQSHQVTSRELAAFARSSMKIVAKMGRAQLISGNSFL